MRLLNWRRQAVLNAMPGLKPEHIRTPWSEFWRRFRRQPVAMAAGLFVLLLIAVAIVAPWVAPFDAENYFDYDRLNDGPSMLHWFGVDSLGRDIFSRVLVGAQISLAAGVFAVLIGAAIGTVLGLVAGYYEGWWDRITMRIGVSIISAASLSFLGLGAQPPTPEWGAMLNEARADMVIAPHVAIFPSLAIFLTVLAFNLLGDGLRDALDPRIKG